MTIDYHIQQTAEVFETAAERLRQAAIELDRLRGAMVISKDLTYAAEAITVIVNIPQACRVDLFATRPLRAINDI